MDKAIKKRYRWIYFFVVVFAIVTICRLFVLQVIDGQQYRIISDSRLSQEIPVKAPRGEILDRYGRALVTNRVGYSISITKSDSNQVINKTIINLTNLFSER